MGYGGQPMKVVQANRALLSKRNTFKKVKAEIQKKAKEDAWKETTFYILCSLVVLYGFYWITMSLFFESV